LDLVSRGFLSLCWRIGCWASTRPLRSSTAARDWNLRKYSLSRPVLQFPDMRSRNVSTAPAAIQDSTPPALTGYHFKVACLRTDDGIAVVLILPLHTISGAMLGCWHSLHAVSSCVLDHHVVRKAACGGYGDSIQWRRSWGRCLSPRGTQHGRGCRFRMDNAYLRIHRTIPGCCCTIDRQIAPATRTEKGRCG
jgi:hypothetical protein